MDVVINKHHVAVDDHIEVDRSCGVVVDNLLIIDALEESFLQQRHLLIEARGRMQQELPV